MSDLVKDRLTATLVEFRRLQLRHGKSCRQGSLSDIFRWQDERQRAFLCLQHDLDVWCEQNKGKVRKAADLQCLIGEIMEGEQDLARQVAWRREQLKQGLKNMRCGRRVLVGYGNSGIGGGACFVSSRM